MTEKTSGKISEYMNEQQFKTMVHALEYAAGNVINTRAYSARESEDFKKRAFLIGGMEYVIAVVTNKAGINANIYMRGDNKKEMEKDSDSRLAIMSLIGKFFKVCPSTLKHKKDDINPNCSLCMFYPVESFYQQFTEDELALFFTEDETKSEPLH